MCRLNMLVQLGTAFAHTTNTQPKLLVESLLIPHLPDPDLELERLVPVHARVELGPVLQGAGVVHGQHVARGGLLVTGVGLALVVDLEAGVLKMEKLCFTRRSVSFIKTHHSK